MADTIHPKARALFDELLMVADEHITTDTATRMAKELGFTDFDVRDYDH